MNYKDIPIYNYQQLLQYYKKYMYLELEYSIALEIFSIGHFEDY